MYDKNLNSLIQKRGDMDDWMIIYKIDVLDIFFPFINLIVWIIL
jgi:hypothetical protein